MGKPQEIIGQVGPTEASQIKKAGSLLGLPGKALLGNGGSVQIRASAGKKLS
jgi:hypothetical protein